MYLILVITDCIEASPINDEYISSIINTIKHDIYGIGKRFESPEIKRILYVTT